MSKDPTRPGRPKGVPNRSTMVARAELEALVAMMRPKLRAALARTAKEKPESFTALYVAALKHMAPPARAPEPGTEDKPMVIEVRERNAQSTHQSEVASAAAHLRARRSGYEHPDEDDAEE